MAAGRRSERGTVEEAACFKRTGQSPAFDRREIRLGDETVDTGRVGRDRGQLHVAVTHSSANRERSIGQRHQDSVGAVLKGEEIEGECEDRSQPNEDVRK